MDTQTLLLRRTIVAVLLADVAGYSRLMAHDDEGTHARLSSYSRRIVRPLVARHHGRVLRGTGDGFLAVFPDGTTASLCALEIQEAIAQEEMKYDEPSRLRFRIGINHGEVIVDDDMVYGDVVNIAARLEAAAQPGSVMVSEAVRGQVVNRTDLDLQDLGFRAFKNIPDLVKVYRIDRLLSAEPTVVASRSIAVPAWLEAGVPSVVVLPFCVQSEAAGDIQLARLLAETLTIRLGALRWFRTLASEPAASPYASFPDPIHVARELDVRYLVKGRLRVYPTRVRVAVQLIDGLTGHQLWAEVIERSVGNMNTLEDVVMARVVAAADTELQNAERARAMAKTPDQLDVYDLAQRGYWHYVRRSRGHLAEAERLFSAAVSRDPASSIALTGEASCKFWTGQWQWSEDPMAALNQSLATVRRAVEADQRYPVARLIMGQTLLFLGHHRAAVEATKSAIALNPFYAGAWAFLGHAQTALGRFREAARSINRAFALVPHDARRFLWLSNLALANFHLGRYDTALLQADEARALHPTHWLSNQVLTTTLATIGRRREARDYVEAVHAIEPGIRLRGFANRMPYHSPDDLDRVLLALQRAGWSD
jgi:adenylate cyclase